MPAYAAFSRAYWASGLAGQLLKQSVVFAVNVFTVTSESRSLMRCTPNVPRTVATFWKLYPVPLGAGPDRKSTRLNSSHTVISYAVFCLKKKIYCMTHSFYRVRTYGSLI